MRAGRAHAYLQHIKNRNGLVHDISFYSSKLAKISPLKKLPFEELIKIGLLIAIAHATVQCKNIKADCLTPGVHKDYKNMLTLTA